MVKIFSLLFLFLILPSYTYAESTANVRVNNNASSNSTSDIKSNTSITVETDGNVTHYQSNEPGSVSVKSVNGVSEIEVNGQKVTSQPASPTIKPTEESTATSGNDKPFSFKEFGERIIKLLFSIVFFWL